MNPLKSPLRRTAAIITAVLFGLIGLAAPAAQAAAQQEDVVVTGSADCDHATHKWTVVWNVTNSYLHDATVQNLDAGPNPIPELEGYVIPHRTGPKTPGGRTFTQIVSGTERQAWVSFTAVGDGVNDANNSDIVPLDDSCQPDEKPCVQPENATFHHTFAVSDTKATATVTLDDDIKLCKDEPVTLVSYFAPRPQFTVPLYLFDHQTGTITNADHTVTLTATLPGCDTEADLFFGGENDVIKEITEDGQRYGNSRLGSASGSGARSSGPHAWFNGGAKGCHQPDVTSLAQCDGSIDVNLSNTGDLGRYPVDFTIKATGFDRTVTVAPGKAQTVRVPAGAGEITVTADDMPTKKINWKRPADCAPPTVRVHNDCTAVTIAVTNPEGAVPATAEVSYGTEKKPLTVAPGSTATVTFKPGKEKNVTVGFPGMGIDDIHAVLETVDCPTTPPTAGPSPTPSGTAGGGGTGGLPITGAAAGAIAGGSALLLVVGGLLFFLARRRKVKFTA